MFKRIVVALDGSECAHRALAVALQLAQASQARLGVCSVVDPILVAGTAPPSPAMDAAFLEMEKAAQTFVSEAVERARQEGLEATGSVRAGVPAFELRKYAREFEADLIVMGTHGRRGFAHFLMGSVAEAILRESAIPVLVVRDSANEEEREHHAEHRERPEHERGYPAGTSA